MRSRRNVFAFTGARGISIFSFLFVKFTYSHLENVFGFTFIDSNSAERQPLATLSGSPLRSVSTSLLFNAKNREVSLCAIWIRTDSALMSRSRRSNSRRIVFMENKDDIWKRFARSPRFVLSSRRLIPFWCDNSAIYSENETLEAAAKHFFGAFWNIYADCCSGDGHYIKRNTEMEIERANFVTAFRSKIRFSNFDIDGTQFHRLFFY